MHVKANGSGCGSMVLLNRDYCYFHYRHYLREHHRILLKTNMEKRAEPAVEIPVLEDRASIQLAIMDVMRALIDQRISREGCCLALLWTSVGQFQPRSSRTSHGLAHATGGCSPPP